MSLDSSGNNIFSLPDTFNLSDPSGFFRHQLLGDLERDFDRARWGQYYKGPGSVTSRNAGPDQQTYGFPFFTKERRQCALNAPKTTRGATICWDHNTHLGCTQVDCKRNSEGGHVQFRNFETLWPQLKMYLLRKGGFKGRKNLILQTLPSQCKN